MFVALGLGSMATGRIMSKASSQAASQLQQIQQLLKQLQQAMEAAQWLQVQACDRQIGALVQQLREQGPDARTQAAIDTLKLHYQQLIQYARQQQQELEQKMKAFNDNKAGVLAYQQTTESRR